MQDWNKTKIGFDLDGVILTEPKFIDIFYRYNFTFKLGSYLNYFFAKPLLIPQVNNYRIITGRTRDLEFITKRQLAKHKINSFNSIYFNSLGYGELNSIVIKSTAIIVFDLEYFVESDQKIIKALKKRVSTKVHVINPKEAIQDFGMPLQAPNFRNYLEIGRKYAPIV